MTTRCGWAGAALLAAAFTVTAAPAAAQDGKQPSTSKSKPKVDWAAQQRAAAKKAEAQKKREAAQKAADEAAKAEAEAEAAAEEAAPPVEAAEAEEAAPAPTEEGADAEPEDVVAAEDEQDAEETETRKETPRDRRRRHHDHDHAPSPDRSSPPPYQWAGPYTMEYIEGAEVPDGYTKVERVRKGLVIGGAVTWGVSWLMAATAAAAIENKADEAAPLYIPVVGPFIAMGTLEADGAGRAGLLINGMAQVAGAAMLIGGLAATKTVLVRTKVAELNVRPGVGNLQFDGTF